MRHASDYFTSYVTLFNRIRLIELIEHENRCSRERRYQLSLVANPETRQHFGPPPAIEASPEPGAVV